MNLQTAKAAEAYLQACRRADGVSLRKSVWMNADGSWMCETAGKNPTAIFTLAKFLGKTLSGPAMEVYGKFFRYSKVYRKFQLKTGEEVWERA